MTHPRPPFTWNVFGSSVQGASHVRANVLNQDAIDWLASYHRAQPLIALAVADGHGNPRYIRSHIGAQAAVRVAKTVLAELGQSFYQGAKLTAIKQMAEQQLPNRLVRSWNQAVDEHQASNPFAADDLDKLDGEAPTRLASNPRIAYGATLVAALVTDAFLLYVQLGDGDIVAVSIDGQVARPPLPADSRLFADATTSLCMSDAWRYVRTYFQPLADYPPALVMLATDGYANSFATEAGFLVAAKDIFDMLKQHRHDSVHMLRNHLHAWLRATSDQGSGDDISVGVIFRER